MYQCIKDDQIRIVILCARVVNRTQILLGMIFWFELRIKLSKVLGIKISCKNVFLCICEKLILNICDNLISKRDNVSLWDRVSDYFFYPYWDVF